MSSENANDADRNEQESAEAKWRGAEIQATGKNTFQIVVVIVLSLLVVVALMVFRGAIHDLDMDHGIELRLIRESVISSNAARSEEHRAQQAIEARLISDQTISLADRIAHHDEMNAQVIHSIERTVEQTCRPKRTAGNVALPIPDLHVHGHYAVNEVAE